MQDHGTNDYRVNEQLMPPMDNVTRNPYQNLPQDTESLRFHNQTQQPKRFGIIISQFLKKKKPFSSAYEGSFCLQGEFWIFSE